MNKEMLTYFKENGFQELEIISENNIFFRNLYFLYFKANKFKEMRSFVGDPESSQQEFYVYFDSILVQFRAMILDRVLDKGKKQYIYTERYSFQNYLIRNNKEVQFKQLEKFLDSQFLEKIEKKGDTEEIFTIRKAIKRITDKYICHSEKDTENYYIEDHLVNPYSEFYILKIINIVLEICGFPQIELKND